MKQKLWKEQICMDYETTVELFFFICSILRLFYEDVKELMSPIL